MKFHIYMQYEQDTGWHVVMCPAMPGCVSQGRTEQEAIDNIKEAILGWLEVEDKESRGNGQEPGLEGKELAIAI